MKPAISTKRAIGQLHQTVQWAADQASPIGYFAALYQSLSGTILEHAEGEYFDNAVHVAAVWTRALNRYLEARHAHGFGTAKTDTWRYVFNTSSAWEPIVLQHLLAGLSAVVHLDLPVAALHHIPAASLPVFEADYHRMHTVVHTVMQETYRTLQRIWPRLQSLERFIGRPGAVPLGVNAEDAGRCMWDWITRVAAGAPAEQAIEIVKQDRVALRKVQKIMRPGLKARIAVQAIRLSERGTVPEKLNVLR